MHTDMNPLLLAPCPTHVVATTGARSQVILTHPLLYHIFTSLHPSPTVMRPAKARIEVRARRVTNSGPRNDGAEHEACYVRGTLMFQGGRRWSALVPVASCGEPTTTLHIEDISSQSSCYPFSRLSFSPQDVNPPNHSLSLSRFQDSLTSPSAYRGISARWASASTSINRS